ncbi:diadenylate cyclase CdaA [Larkinella soli]|uniref:diadenylate cyclase CdaA n=1 Tax=Larkinella soli TaxID=1770527 RepID=UPI000FFC9349|nr:diadenylate cyclase CdaA [Larkinella soli]
MKIGFLDIEWVDVLDVLLLAFLLYQIYYLVKGTIASRIFLGYLLVYLLFLVAKAVGLELLTTILGYFISVGALALIIIFQQEIRRFLLIIGKSTNVANSRLFRRWIGQPEVAEPATPLRPIVDACKAMAAEFTGGLVVVGKNDELEKFIQSGDALDAIISKRLLLSIAGQYSPLRDGAVIITDGRVRAARCILPVSDNDELSTTTGFRHRAALGISEVTDAAAVAISEETGRISLAIDGELFPNLSSSELEERLRVYLFEPARARKREGGKDTPVT